MNDPVKDLINVEECALKIVSDNVVALPQSANVLELKEAQVSESRCENGVCALNWKPKRVA